MEKITRFERARLISARALQIALGAPVLVKTSQELDPKELAKLELEKGVIPIAVLREYPNGEMRRIEVS